MFVYLWTWVAQEPNEILHIICSCICCGARHYGGLLTPSALPRSTSPSWPEHLQVKRDAFVDNLQPESQDQLQMFRSSAACRHEAAGRSGSSGMSLAAEGLRPRAQSAKQRRPSIRRAVLS